MLAVDDPYAGEGVGLVDEIGETEVVQLADGTWGEDVAAGLRSGEDPTFDDDDVVASGGEPRGGSTTRWSAADDQDVSGRSGSGAGGKGDQGSASGA